MSAIQTTIEAGVEAVVPVSVEAAPAGAAPQHRGRRTAEEKREARRRAAARRGELLGELLRILGLPEPDTFGPQKGKVAVTFGPADEHQTKLPAVGSLGSLAVLVLRHQVRGGLPSLPLFTARFALDPVSGEVNCGTVAGYDLTAPADRVEAPRGLPHLERANLAAAAINLRHAALEADRPADRPELPDFLCGFDLAGFDDANKDKPLPVVFEHTALIEDLAVDAQCEIEQLWLDTAVYFRRDAAGNYVELPGHPGDAPLPPGCRHVVAWPVHFFARDAATRYETHPVDGSPRPADGEPMPEGWFLRDGVPTPCAQRPEYVLYRFHAQQMGRQVRNPAWSMLRKHRKIGFRGSCAQFREQMQAGWAEYYERWCREQPQYRDSLGATVHTLAHAFGLACDRAAVEALFREPAAEPIVPGEVDIRVFRVSSMEDLVISGPGYRLDLGSAGEAPADAFAPDEGGLGRSEPERAEPAGPSPRARRRRDRKLAGVVECADSAA